MNQETLQLINILLTSGILLGMIGAGVAWGRMRQQVDNHDKEIGNLRKGQHDLRDMFVGHIAREKEEL